MLIYAIINLHDIKRLFPISLFLFAPLLDTMKATVVAAPEHPILTLNEL